MAVGCVQHYSTHYIKKIGKSLEPFFHKVQKTEKKGQKGAKKGILAILGKEGCAMFEPVWMPNFMPNFRKILSAVSEKSRSRRTHAHTRTRVIL